MGRSTAWRAALIPRLPRQTPEARGQSCPTSSARPPAKTLAKRPAGRLRFRHVHDLGLAAVPGSRPALAARWRRSPDRPAGTRSANGMSRGLRPRTSAHSRAASLAVRASTAISRSVFSRRLSSTRAVVSGAGIEDSAGPASFVANRAVREREVGLLQVAEADIRRNRFFGPRGLARLDDLIHHRTDDVPDLRPAFLTGTTEELRVLALPQHWPVAVVVEHPALGPPPQDDRMARAETNAHGGAKALRPRPSTGPSGVLDQSAVRMREAISPGRQRSARRA